MFINKVLLSVSLVMLITVGLYFSIKLNFPQLRIIRLFKGIKKDENTEISPIKSLMLTLGARIGVGSLAGISLAIYIGGIGTIFWIWIGSLITCILTYCESYLGQINQVKENNQYYGGPLYYIKNKKISLIYGIILILTYILGFIPIQANTIISSINNYLNINKFILTLILSMITLIPILKGLNKIMDITSKIVPIIAIIYLLITTIVFFKNLNLIPNILINIIRSAFNPKTFLLSFIIGIQRGIFITESGLGTSSISSSCTYAKNKIDLSLFQILGVHFTVFIICTSTALLILTSNYSSIIINTINGIELTQYAYIYHFGNIGNIILIVSIFFLSYSTILAGYFYSEQTWNNLFKKNNKYLKIITIFFLIIGSIIKATNLWKTADIFIEILIIINVYYLYKNRNVIVFNYKK